MTYSWDMTWMANTNSRNICFKRRKGLIICPIIYLFISHSFKYRSIKRMNSFKAFRTQWGTARVMIATESVQPITDASAQNPGDHNIHGATISCSSAVLPFSAFLSFFFPIYIRKGTGKQQTGASLFLKITIQNCIISVFTGDICSTWHWIAYLVVFSFYLGTGWIEQRLLLRPWYHSYFCYGKRKVDGRE